MPYIATKTSAKITDEQKSALTRAFGEAITLIKGKSERWLMLDFSAERSMAFRGTSCEHTCMVEVSLFGKATQKEYSALTAKICEIIAEVLGVSPERTYVKYSEIDTWGYNGENF